MVMLAIRRYKMVYNRSFCFLWLYLLCIHLIWQYQVQVSLKRAIYIYLQICLTWYSIYWSWRGDNVEFAGICIPRLDRSLAYLSTLCFLDVSWSFFVLILFGSLAKLFRTLPWNKPENPPLLAAWGWTFSTGSKIQGHFRERCERRCSSHGEGD